MSIIRKYADCVDALGSSLRTTGRTNLPTNGASCEEKLAMLVELVLRQFTSIPIFKKALENNITYKLLLSMTSF